MGMSPSCGPAANHAAVPVRESMPNSLRMEQLLSRGTNGNCAYTGAGFRVQTGIVKATLFGIRQARLRLSLMELWLVLLATTAVTLAIIFGTAGWTLGNPLGRPRTGRCCRPRRAKPRTSQRRHRDLDLPPPNAPSRRALWPACVHGGLGRFHGRWLRSWSPESVSKGRDLLEQPINCRCSHRPGRVRDRAQLHRERFHRLCGCRRRRCGCCADPRCPLRILHAAAARWSGTGRTANAGALGVGGSPSIRTNCWPPGLCVLGDLWLDSCSVLCAGIGCAASVRHVSGPASRGRGACSCQ